MFYDLSRAYLVQGPEGLLDFWNEGANVPFSKYPFFSKLDSSLFGVFQKVGLIIWGLRKLLDIRWISDTEIDGPTFVKKMAIFFLIWVIVCLKSCLLLNF